jgi:hypothetical protein
MLMLLFYSGFAVLMALLFGALFMFSWHLLLEALATTAVHLG